jgi:hypothetical protein
MPEIRLAKNRSDRVLIWIILSLAAVLAYDYYIQIDVPNLVSRLDLHQHIIAGTAASPYRYRVLVPFIGEVLRLGFATILSPSKSFLLAYAIFDLLAIVFLLLIFFAYLQLWFSREQAFIGTLFMAGMMTLVFKDHIFQPWSFLEVGLFTASLYLMVTKKPLLLGIVVAVASLNRETGVFIPLTYLITSLDFKSIFKNGIPALRKQARTIWLSLAFFSIWLVIYLGLRWLLGSAPQVNSVEALYSQNTSSKNLLYALLNWILFFGAFWIFPILGYKHAPEFLRRVLIIVPFYLLSVLVWGVWYEVRLLMPLYPVLIPLGMAFVFGYSTISSTPLDR